MWPGADGRLTRSAISRRDCSGREPRRYATIIEGPCCSGRDFAFCTSEHRRVSFRRSETNSVASASAAGCGPSDRKFYSLDGDHPTTKACRRGTDSPALLSGLAMRGRRVRAGRRDCFPPFAPLGLGHPHGAENKGEPPVGPSVPFIVHVRSVTGERRIVKAIRTPCGKSSPNRISVEFAVYSQVVPDDLSVSTTSPGPQITRDQRRRIYL